MRTSIVVEAEAGRVVSIEPKSDATKTVTVSLEPHVPGGGPFPKTMLFNGIAVGDSGGRRRLYITGDRSNLIHRLDL